jgi:hypothetical protein
MNLDKLNREQVDFAIRVGNIAQEMGLNPDYAVMVLYGDTNFNPQAIAEAPDQVEDEIRASLGILRERVLEHRDPEKAAAAYFEGDESKFITSGNIEDLQEHTQNIFQNISQIGRFPQSVLFGTEVDIEEPTPPANAEEKRKQEDEQIARDRAGAQAVGAVLGAVPSIVRAGKDAFRRGPPKPPAQPSAPVPGPAIGPAAAPDGLPGGPASSGRGQPSSGGPASGRPQPPLGGTAVQNYGRAFGLGEIEAGRAADMTKQPGGVHDLTTQRRQGLQRVQDLFPNQFREDPRFGGLMTPEQRPGPGPRGPTGQIGAGKPPPIVTPPPPKPGGLEQVSKLFTKIAETPAVQSLGRGISRYGGPPAAGYTAFGEASTAADELARKNYPAVAASGLSALGAGMMLNPGTFVPGGILSLAGPAYRTFIEGDQSLLPEKFPDKTFLLNTRTR